ncbi:Bax inhibitor-1 family protein [Candidatus Nesciobacter abundans]|uniref:Bax inhibitor-1/YccA family protein n=1 Tax=Candidatus Nesciobacter abundans TaxID=2601668 RepID=A0A5C0UHQ6_9PROT|nr:Bax inhibitor-1 family protein [Candidatus Nesciobacter abundans]QEK38892.1 hypothetical protein FZC36_00355 [Candidatus Nesciobacter abundans]
MRFREDNVSVQSGLSDYFAAVYKFLGVGFAFTGALAFCVSSFLSNRSFAMVSIISIPAWIIMSLYFRKVNIRSSYSEISLMYWSYCSVMGISSAYIFKVFTSSSIVSMFFLTASIFLVVSYYGASTKTDLSSYLSLAFYTFFAVSIYSLFAYFVFGSTSSHILLISLSTFVSVVSIAFTSQNLVNIYYSNQVSDEDLNKAAILSSLVLLMDVIIILRNLLYLFGDRRSD